MTFRSLEVRNYRLFLGGQVVSNTGTWMQRVGQDWLVLQLTHSGAAVGVTTGLQFLPLLLFGLWGGVLADRYPKRRLLVVTQASMGLLALALGVLAVTGLVQVWHVYLLAFGLGMATAVDNPTRQAFVVEMVGHHELPNAVGLNSATFNMARIVGPAVAGFLIVLAGTGQVFLINALSYAAVIAGLLAIRERELFAPTHTGRRAGQLREALRYVRGRPDLLLPIVIVGFVGTFGFNFQMMTALFAKGVFHEGAESYGLLSTALAVGSFMGALLAARRGRPRRRLVVLAAISFGFLEAAAAFMPTYETFMALLVPTGVAALTMSTAANSTVQLGVSPDMRGRVMGLYMLVFLGGTPLGAPLMGWLAEVLDPRWSLFTGGVLSAAAALVATWLLARRGGMVIRPRVWPRPGLRVELLRTSPQDPELTDTGHSA
ncbi:MAG: MFS transporter [Streptomycetales bacterium]